MADCDPCTSRAYLRATDTILLSLYDIASSNYNVPFVHGNRHLIVSDLSRYEDHVFGSSCRALELIACIERKIPLLRRPSACLTAASYFLRHRACALTLSERHLAYGIPETATPQTERGWESTRSRPPRSKTFEGIRTTKKAYVTYV